MTKTASLLVALLLTLLVGACSKSGQVYVTKSLDTKLDQFPAVNVSATGTTAKTNRAARKFEKMLGERLKKGGVFKEIDPSAGLVMRCKVTQMDLGDELKRELSLKGKAKVTIEIRITEPDGALLGHITVKAQTTKKNKTDEPAVRVLEMAADAVVDYLKERSGKKQSAAKKPSSESKKSSDDEAKVDEADELEEALAEEEEEEEEEAGEEEEEEEEEE